MIKETIKKELSEFFRKNAADHFIGGSERFGFTKTDKSDIDFFVLVDSSNPSSIIHTTELLSLFPRKVEQIFNLYGSNCEQYSLLGGFVHITLYSAYDTLSQKEYSNLYQEHIRLEKLLQDIPNLKRMADYLRFDRKMKGAEIYRTLITLF